MKMTSHITGKTNYSHGSAYKKVKFNINKGTMTISAYRFDPYTPEEIELEIALSRTETKNLTNAIKPIKR